MDLAMLRRVTAETNNFVAHNHIKIVDVDLDRAVAELTIVPDSLNPLNLVHGGALFTMADYTAAVAARSNGMRYVTQNSSFEFIHAAQEGTIRAVSTIRHRGRSTCLVAVEVTDEKGSLLAEGKFTMFCLGAPAKID